MQLTRPKWGCAVSSSSIDITPTMGEGVNHVCPCARICSTPHYDRQARTTDLNSYLVTVEPPVDLHLAFQPLWRGVQIVQLDCSAAPTLQPH